jgi:hypothetical protein
MSERTQGSKEVGPTLDQRIAARAQELIDLVEPQGIVVGHLTVHIHQAKPVRISVGNSLKLDTSQTALRRDSGGRCGG